MNEEGNGLPPLANIPEFLQADGWYEEEIDGQLLDFTEPYKPPRWTLERDGIPFANMGELHIVSGKAGHGKTNLMSQFMTAILSGKFGNTLYTKPDTIEQSVVLYIDTEMGKDDTIAIKNRVCTMAGLDYQKPQQRFQILRLRDVESADERWRKILKAIWVVKPTDIFIDGLLDIVRDYNDQKECQPIIRKCMMTATHYDASIWLVLHENPLVDKLVGTLGSITQRKVSEIFTVRKHKQSEEKQRTPNRPEIYFSVTQLKARGRDVADWDFEVIPNAGGWGMPIELDSQGAQINNPEAARIYNERKEADDYFSKYNWTSSGATYTELDRWLHTKGVTSNRRRNYLLNTALEAGIIWKDYRKKYFYKGMNKEQNDTPEALPFPKQSDEAPF